MNTIELKKYIQEEIEHIDDKYILEGISRIIDLNSNEDHYVVSSELKEKLARADKQIDDGHYISHVDLKQKVKSWFNV